jgi:hypothetical protein
MSNAGEPQDLGQPHKTDTPGDIPAERPASLARLDALIGKWEMEVSFEPGYFGPDSPPVTERGGRVTFDWLDGKFFLIQRFAVEHPAAPSGIAVIGAGAAPEAFSQHYYDSRGVARVYEMGLDDGVWTLRRAAPGFWQRYTGVFTADGKTIEGTWQASADGAEWKHDFRLTYIRIG